MSFGNLNASYTELRDALRTNVSVEALGDLNIRPPSGDADEASFLRLTAWCFSLLFEVGRFSVPFLLALNVNAAIDNSSEGQKAVRQNVQRLRTFMYHNLGFEDDHDMTIRRQVSDWFVETCGSAFPTSQGHWSKCFKRLAEDVCSVVLHCSEKLSAVLSSPEDKDIICEDLRRRLKRALQPYEFDGLVEESAARLGQKINARVFRESRIAGWQVYLMAMPDDLDPKSELERMIDGQVADHFRSQLPIRTQEIMNALALDPGPDVGKAIEIARRIFSEGTTDKEDLLSKTQIEFDKLRTLPK
jgi:hypothetical protein